MKKIIALIASALWLVSSQAAAPAVRHTAAVSAHRPAVKHAAAKPLHKKHHRHGKKVAVK